MCLFRKCSQFLFEKNCISAEGIKKSAFCCFFIIEFYFLSTMQSVNNMEPTSECPVCLEKVDLKFPACNHGICIDCLSKWRSCCILCRRPYDEIFIVETLGNNQITCECIVRYFGISEQNINARFRYSIHIICLRSEYD